MPHALQRAKPGRWLRSARPPQTMQALRSGTSAMAATAGRSGRARISSFRKRLTRQLMPAVVSAELPAANAFCSLAWAKASRTVSPVHDIARAAFDLVEYQANVFANDAEKEQLYPAKEAQRGNQGRPPRHIHAANGIEQQLADPAQEADDGESQAETAAEPERQLGEGANAVEGEGEQRRRAIVGATELARSRLERDMRYVEANPADQAAQKGVLFRQLGAHHLGDAPRDQPEIGSPDRQIDDTELDEQLVEPLRRQSLESAGLAAVRAHRLHDFGALFPQLNQARDQLGRMLQIAVQHDGCVSAAVVKPGDKRGLMTKASGHHEDFHPRVIGADHRQDHLGTIRGRIENVENAKRVSLVQRVKHSRQPIMEESDDLLLPIYRTDHIDRRHLRTHPAATRAAWTPYRRPVTRLDSKIDQEFSRHQTAKAT